MLKVSTVLRFLAFISGRTCLMKRIVAYSNNAAWMKIMHDIIQPEIEVKDSVLGDLAMTPIIMFITVSVKMISNAILPGIASDGITKLIYNVKGNIFVFISVFFKKHTHDTRTKKPDGM